MKSKWSGDQNNLLFGRKAIAAAISPDFHVEGVKQLHEAGRMPGVVRVDRVYIGDRHAIEAGKKAGLLRAWRGGGESEEVA